MIYGYFSDCGHAYLYHYAKIEYFVDSIYRHSDFVAFAVVVAVADAVNVGPDV